MIGRISCALRGHDWRAITHGPSGRQWAVQCGRCGEYQRDSNGITLVYFIPRPGRHDRRRQDKDNRRTDAMLSKAERDLAAIEELLG